MSIKLDAASQMVQAAIAKAEELGIGVTLPVCDAGGRLVALNRMDGAIKAAVFGSQGKAAGAAVFNRRTGLLEPQAESPGLKSIIAVIGQNIILRQGVCPLYLTAWWWPHADSAVARPSRTRSALKRP